MPTASEFSGTPQGLKVEIAPPSKNMDDSGWVDRSQYIRRGSVHITRPKPGEPGRAQLDLWTQGGSLVVSDMYRVRIYDPFMNPGGLYVRYFAGWVLGPNYSLDGNINLNCSLDCTGYDYLWKHPPARPSVKTRIGAAPVWLSNHQYFVGDVVQPFPSNGHQYTVTSVGAGGGISGATPPTFPTGAGATVTEGSVGPPNTQITWQESGSSNVTDVTAINQMLDIFFPSTLITITRTGIKNLIASVPSIEITEEMTPDDVMHAIALSAQSVTYYSVKNAWAAGTSYAKDSEVEPTTPNGFYYVSNNAGTSHASVEPTWPTTINQTVNDNGIIWVCRARISRWAANVPYVRGQRIQPQSNSLFYYDCVTAGTSGGSIPSFTTTLGATTTSGTAVFMCMGNIAVAPTWYFKMPSDNGAHTASWAPDVWWVDTNSSGANGIQLIGPAYSDQVDQDSTHIHASTIAVTRDGNNYANCWYVWGKNGAFARVPDQAAIDSKGGQIITAVYTDTSDTGPADENECIEKGKDLLYTSTFQETVSITAPDILDPVMMQVVSLATVENVLFGITTATQYPVTNVEMTFPSDGPVMYNVELGSALLTDREDPLSRRRGGREYQTLGNPPRLCTFGSDWVLSNINDCLSHTTTVQLQWRSGQEANLYSFNLELQVQGETARRRLGLVLYPQQYVTISGLPVNTNITLYISAINNHGQFLRNPDGTPLFAQSPTITTADMPSPPPTPGISSIVTGAEGPNLFYADVTVTHPSGDHSHGGYVTAALHSGPSAPIIIEYIPRNAVYPYTVRIHGVQFGSVYDFRAAVISACDIYSAEAAQNNVTITVTPPPAPSINTPVSGGYSPQLGYYAMPVINHPSGDHSHGGWVEWWQGGRTEHHIQAIPRTAIYPYQPTIGPLDLGVTYSITAYVVDQYDQPSTAATTRTYTPGGVPAINLPLGGWDNLAYDGTLAQWVPVSPATISDFAIDTSVASFESLSSLKMIVPASTTKEIIAPQISGKPNETIKVSGAVKRSTGTGTAPTARFYAKFYKQDGTASVGADQDVIATFTPSTSFPANFVEAKITMPSDAYSFALVAKGVGSSVVGTGTYNLWWAFPRIERQIDGNNFAPLVTLDSTQIDLTSTSKITGGSKVQFDVNGLSAQGSGTGVGVFDFYNEVGVRIGRIYSSGSANNGTLSIIADYDGSGSTNISMQAQDFLTLSTSANSEIIDFTNNGLVYDSGASTRYHKLVQGSVILSGAALSTSATNGFTYIPTCAGKPTGTPSSQSGTVPIVFDTINHVYWAYDNGAWVAIAGEGTSFPSSPYTGMRFYRTDLRVECYYDGTRWLGPLDTWRIYDPESTLTPVGFTTNQTPWMRKMPQRKASYWVEEITWHGKVDTTNNGSNYWTLRFGHESNTLGGSVDCDITTAAWTAGTLDIKVGTSFSTNPLDFTTTGVYTMFLELVQTGAPGKLSLWGVSLTVRQVYT